MQAHFEFLGHSAALSRDMRARTFLYFQGDMFSIFCEYVCVYLLIFINLRGNESCYIMYLFNVLMWLTMIFQLGFST